MSLKFLTLLSLLFLMPEVSAQSITLGGEITSSPVVVDIDQNPDNGLEIVVGTESGYLYVMYQNGTSLPGWPKYVKLSSSYKPYFEYSSPAIADINDDGLLEIVIASIESQTIGGSGGTAYVSAYNLTGSLIWYYGTTPCTYSSPAVADVTGDGKIDVLTGSKSGILYNFYSDGNLYWSKSFGSGYVSTPAIGDMDGDGILDIVIASSADGSIRVIKGDGEELMAFQTDGLGASSPALGDLDNDGDPEIVAVSINGKLYAWNRDGTLLDGFPVQAGGTSISSPALADLDEDGMLDIVLTSEEGYVYAYRWNGELLPGFPLVEQGAITSSPALADLDGDGKLEIISGTYIHLFNETTGDTTNTGKVYAWHINGTLFDGFPEDTGGFVKSSPAVADLDGNGKNEIVIGSNDGNLYIWETRATSDNHGWPMFHYDERNTRMYDAPTAKISSPENGSFHQEGALISFSAIVHDVDGSIASYEWSSSIDGILSHSSSFTSDLSLGNHIISLTVKDDENKVAKTKAEITVTENNPPTASIASPEAGSSFSHSESITFSGSGTDTDGTIASYLWTSSIGGVLSSSSSFVSDLAIGTHVITLKVTDNNGATGTVQVSITVLNNLPIADAGSDQSAVRGQLITFDGSGSSDPDGDILTYSWDLGDGSTETGISPTHSYSTLGNKTVTLTVNDEYGGSNTDTMITTIYNRDPIAEAGQSKSAFKDQIVTFDASNSSDPDGDSLTYSWDFGDGSIGTGVTTTHIYSTVGNYTVTLTAVDEFDGSDKDTIVVYVYKQGQKPILPKRKRETQASPIGEGVTTLDSTLSRDIIKDLGLRTEQFYDAPISLVAAMAVIDEYPAPKDIAVRSVLINSVKTLSGDVYELSAEKVLKRYRYANTLIITRGDLPVDSLAAVAYAKSKNMPILLTKPGGLPSVALNAISDLNPNKIIIFGGPVAVSEEVESGLKKIADVQRIWGETRYETAIELAKMIDQPDIIVITDGEDPNTNAVIISASYHAPLLYVGGEEIPQSVKDYLSKHKTAKVVLVGVSEGATGQINDLMNG